MKPRARWLGAAVVLLGLIGGLWLWGKPVRRQPPEAPEKITIRFAHWQLENGLRAAYDVLAKRYMELHPQVRIEQMAVPERVYGSWLRTQLVGGTAPDLIEFGQITTGDADEVLARHFTSLTDALEKPNPYNKGTPLEYAPWRETFIDGLDGVYRSSSLQDYFKIPMSLFTVRIYYNRRLWRQLLGDTLEPRTFAELEVIAQRVRSLTGDGDRQLFALAGAGNSFHPVDRLFGSQTQKLALALDADRNFNTTAPEIGLGLLRGRWDMDTPELGRSLELVRAMMLMMPPGYLQMTRADATFLFIQQRALMISAGSWDATSLMDQVPFDVGVFRLPLPATDDPLYGPGMIGSATSEADLRTEAAFSLWKGSPHQEIALDFLRFVTSQQGCRLFVEHSRWLPAIVGVEPQESFRAFMPELDGFTNGFDARLGNLGPEVRQLWETNLTLLTLPEAGVAAMQTAYRSKFREAVLADLQRWTKVAWGNTARQDTTVMALLRLSESGQDDAWNKYSETLQQQNRQEAEALWIADEVQTAAGAMPDATSPEP